MAEQCKPSVHLDAAQTKFEGMTLKTQIPRNNWGVFVRIHYSYEADCVRNSGAGMNDLWVRQEIHAEGDVWYERHGPRKHFTKDITEYFKLGLYTSEAYNPDPKSLVTMPDDQWTYWFKGSGSDENADLKLPCGVDVHVHMEVTVGHLMQYPARGGAKRVSGRDFAYDKSTIRTSGPVHTISIPDRSATLAASAIGQSAHTDAEYYFEEDRVRFAPATLSYHIEKDECPGKTLPREYCSWYRPPGWRGSQDLKGGGTLDKYGDPWEENR